MGSEAQKAILRHVNGLWPSREDLPSLIESAEEVERTIASPGYRAIKRVIDAEIAQVDAKLDGNKTLEHVEYARLHGRRSALAAFEHAATAIVDRAQERRQQAEQANAAAEPVAGR